MESKGAEVVMTLDRSLYRSSVVLSTAGYIAKQGARLAPPP
jgi:hypothetical protein